MLGGVSEPMAGMIISSNVRLLRPLGEGGMGSVWLAEHLSLRTSVVVKFMAPQLVQSAEAVARFSREAAAASQVKSPHVVHMLDHGVLESGSPYIVMELLEGRDLEEHIRTNGRLDPRDVVAIVAQLARALAKAHERGIVHRDIKPSNIFLCDAGGGELFVKLLDFGIAKSVEGGLSGGTTRSGSFLGSPFYMSPEQVVGAKTIDWRTDLWSLGVVAFEALTGEKPFVAETVGALALKIHRDPIPAPSSIHPALGPSVDAWFAKACAREPGARFGSAREMADALVVAVTGEPVRSTGLLEGLGTTTDSASGSGPSQEVAKALRSGVDARSETGAGVGISPHERAGSSRGKWVALALVVAVVAGVGVGRIVPRLAGAASATAVVASGSASASTEPTAPGSRAAEWMTAAASASASAPASASASAPAPASASASPLAPRTQRPKVPPSAAPPAPSASAPRTTTRGTDDDIW
jgi:serine/threonine-protein kinase